MIKNKIWFLVTGFWLLVSGYWFLVTGYFIKMDYIPIADSELKEMLETIGINSLDDLFKDIPKEIPRARFNLPPPLSEPGLIRTLEELGGLNRTVKDMDSYLGAGSYEHFIPTVVANLTERAEFLTAYTPYQAEASQGTLQSIYEYQTLICQLTGMDVSNASLYDGGSALAESALLAVRNKDTSGGKIFISSTVHPNYREVTRTYLKGCKAELIEIPYKNGITDVDFINDNIDENTLAILVQSPNFFGCLEPTWEIPALAKRYNALSILSSYPLSLGLLNDPGNLGFDIAVGEGQCFGTPLSFGGPYLGYFACKKELLRKMPGRIVGRTKDTKGRTGFVLTLQTREQHIRREKAVSNICTNSAMNALSACIYLSVLGMEGLRELAEINVNISHYAKDRLCRINGMEQVFSQPFFNEFVIRGEIFQKRLLKAGIIGGLSLDRFYPELKGCYLFCVTETKTKNQIDRLVDVIRKCDNLSNT